MIRSLAQYLHHFGHVLSHKEKQRMLREEFKRAKGRSLVEKAFQEELAPEEKKEKLRKGMDGIVKWLMTAQEQGSDDGIPSFHLVHGWGSSYPETTGYIIPSLLRYAERNGKEEVRDRGLKAADWLVRIQKENGGWQGMRIEDDRPPVVFNTGQVIRGLLAAYERTGAPKYLEAARKGGDWLCELQEAEGYWIRNSSPEGQARVFTSFVDAPLIRLAEASGEDRYREAAKRNLEWIVQEKQHSNGWFPDCDNTVHKNDRPILHTIAYTIDGLLDSGELLGAQDLVQAASKPAEVLRDLFLDEHYLHGRYDREWKGSEHTILTGDAQIAIVWQKLYRSGYGEKYFRAAKKMNEFLLRVQDREHDLGGSTKGALFGSFPFWGRYEKFAFPNWGMKFFLDSLALEEELNSPKSGTGSGPA